MRCWQATQQASGYYYETSSSISPRALRAKTDAEAITIGKWLGAEIVYFDDGAGNLRTLYEKAEPPR